MRRFAVEVIVSTIATLIATVIFATLRSPDGPAAPVETRPLVRAWMPSVTPTSGMPFAIDAELLWPSPGPKSVASHMAALGERSARDAHRAERQAQPRTALRSKPACDPAAACRDMARTPEIPPAVQPIPVVVVRDESQPLLQRPKRLLLSAASDAIDFGQGLIRTVHSAAGELLSD